MNPKCTPQQMVKVIRRNMKARSDAMIPEHNLILAIIGSAISDLSDKWYRKSSLSFFNGELFELYCSFMGLNPDAIKELLVMGGYLDNVIYTPEKPEKIP